MGVARGACGLIIVDGAPPRKKNALTNNRSKEEGVNTLRGKPQGSPQPRGPIHVYKSNISTRSTRRAA